MNALKTKVDEGIQLTHNSIAKMQKELEAKSDDRHAVIARMAEMSSQETAKLKGETLQLKKKLSEMEATSNQETLELKGQLAEILQLLRSKP